MKKRFQFSVAVIIFATGFGGMKLIASTGNKNEHTKEAVDIRPVVGVSQLTPTDFTVEIESFGAVAPMERTMLSAQVTGEVISWHPDFVAGGIIPRGEILFSIEKEAYEAAVLLAEANLQQAKADLVQEQAQADVAAREAKNLGKTTVSDLYLRKTHLLSANASVKSAQAQLNIANNDLEKCDVRAPYDALVIERNIGVGDFVSVGTVAAELNNIEVAEIIVPVAGFDSKFLRTVSSKQDVIIHQSNTNDIVKGTLNRDLGVIDEDTRMANYVVRVDDPYSIRSDHPVLKFGTYVSVSFAGITLEHVYSVPQELINRGQLWMVDTEGKLFSHSVSVLREAGPSFIIKADKQIDRPVVTTLPEYPKLGMSVKVLEASHTGTSDVNSDELTINSQAL